MRCPKCGTENRDSAKFCDECGFELPTVAPYAREMFSQEAHGSAYAAPAPAGASQAASAFGSEALTGDASEDEFAAMFNDSGTVKLTHIAEKLRKPESSGSVVFLPDDDAEAEDALLPEDDSLLGIGSDPLIGEGMHDAITGELDEMDSGFPDDFPGAFPDGLPDDDLLTGDPLPDLPADEPLIGAAIPDLPDDDLYSVDTAPLSTADVHRAIEEDDESTVLAAEAAAAAAAARAKRSQIQSPSSTLEMPVVPAVPASSNSAPKDAHSFLAFSSGKRRRFTKRFKMGLVISLCVIAAAIAVLGITYALQIWGGKNIPDVTGASSADARYILEESGFFVEEKLIVSDDIEGIVIEVQPEPGSRQPVGSTVTIGVSTFRKIPDIIGMPLEEAQNLLGENGYTDTELVMKKSDEEEGNVLGVTPAVGTRANAETHVTIEVATPYLVPDVVGDIREDAEAKLDSEGFSSEIEYDYSDDVPEGCVLRTVPAAGEACKTTTPVQLVIAVSRATEMGNLTSALFEGRDEFRYNGNRYQYVKGSFAVVSCPDRNTIDFTVRGRLLDQHQWPDGRVETWIGDESTISSSAMWSDSNEYLGMDPDLLG